MFRVPSHLGALLVFGSEAKQENSKPEKGIVELFACFASM
jgi:hypothetical protein